MGRHSRCLEWMLFHVVQRFNLVVVRDRGAVESCEQHRLAHRLAVISGSVDTQRFFPNETPKKYDLILVARDIKEKQAHFFLELVAELRRTHPAVGAALVGDGPLTRDLQERARRFGIEWNVVFLGRDSYFDEFLEPPRRLPAVA